MFPDAEVILRGVSATCMVVVELEVGGSVDIRRAEL